MATTTSVKLNGREVTNPVARFLMMVGASLVGCVAVAGAVLVIGLLLLLSPLLIVAHGLLRAFGRQGFLTHEGDSYSVAVGSEGFRRRSS